MCDLDTEMIQGFLVGKEQAGLAWWTRADLKNILSSIFTTAKAWRYWSDPNPVKGVRIGQKRAKHKRRILTDEEIRHLLEALPAKVRLMVETAVSTGMRVSELLALCWRCVDLERGLVQVEERYYREDTDEPKTERSRRVLPLSYLVDSYCKHKPTDAKPDQYVFQRQGEPLDDRALLKDVIRPVAKRLGLYFPRFGWHSFRRQNLTVIQEEGATVFEAQAGHSRPVMTGEYTVTYLERRVQAVRRLQERLHISGQPDLQGNLLDGVSGTIQ